MLETDMIQGIGDIQRVLSQFLTIASRCSNETLLEPMMSEEDYPSAVSSLAGKHSNSRQLWALRSFECPEAVAVQAVAAAVGTVQAAAAAEEE
mmetsp:Transcript_46344/g.145380  ORF Transcript_46344/g.145380 Transcript_46344/m.145380 type:complete len:93 (+) Transcript_46344:1149-1427(+)